MADAGLHTVPWFDWSCIEALLADGTLRGWGYLRALA